MNELLDKKEFYYREISKGPLKVLDLEPLIDIPELFEKGRVLESSDFDEFPILQSRFNELDATAQQTIAEKSLDEEGIRKTLQARDDQFNPFRVSKNTVLLTWSKEVLGDAFKDDAREAYGEKYEVLMNKLEKQIRLVASKKSSEARMSHDEVTDTFMIAKLAKRMIVEK